MGKYVVVNTMAACHACKIFLVHRIFAADSESHELQCRTEKDKQKLHTRTAG